MYEWIWRRLPGGMGTRATSMVIILIAMVALLWFLVFPWATAHLPIDQA
jgi:hypothetical protein